jgi:hypothetical protein
MHLFFGSIKLMRNGSEMETASVCIRPAALRRNRQLPNKRQPFVHPPFSRSGVSESIIRLEIQMKRTLTYLAAAGALVLAACFPVVASAGHHHGHGHGHGHGWDDDDWNDHGPRWVYGRRWGGGPYPSYGVSVGPSYGYYADPNQCYAPGYGWYPCPYYNYGY